MHLITIFPLNASLYWNAVYKTLDTWSILIYTEATVSGLKTAIGGCIGPLYYYTDGKWLSRHSRARIQRVSELVSTMFPSRNLDYVHRKEATLQSYALILCCRLLAGHTPSHFSFIQVFFSLNAIFPGVYSMALTRSFTPLPQYICISVGVEFI